MMKALPLAALAIGLFSACDLTLFGDSEPGLDNPFTRGSSVKIEDGSVTEPVAVIASQRYPGTLYALADNGLTLFALDDKGQAQGTIDLSGVSRNNWRDLALHNGNILILGSSAIAQNVIYRFDEPSNPPPFNAQISLNSSQSVFVGSLGLSTCESIGTAAELNQATLLCGNEFYRFELANEGGTASAEAAGLLPELPANVVDFSVSPAGQFALLTLCDQLRVAQSSGDDWGDAFVGGGNRVEFDHEEFRAATSSFAFRGTLLHTLGKRDQDSWIFTIFNP